MKCVIVDDEPLAQEVLENYVQRVEELKLVKKCSNAMEAVQTLHQEKVDLLFLDIQMPVLNGLSFLKSLKDYLLKPISFERFLKAVNKAIDQRKNVQEELATAEYLFLKVDNKFVKVNYTDIVYIEGMKDYLKIFVKEKLLVVHKTMKAIEDMLPKNKFIRVHKSYIVSLGAVNSIVGNMVEIHGKEIPIGANYKEQLIKVVFKLSN
jgi:DNA-binding LytR/AlgR family response regulator